MVGTEHVLLAILATHEVALRYPHLSRENAPTRTPGTRAASDWPVWASTTPRPTVC
ncbi:hypothetical protein QBA75_17745 [Streptomyces stelliscabiei]